MSNSVIAQGRMEWGQKGGILQGLRSKRKRGSLPKNGRGEKELLVKVRGENGRGSLIFALRKGKQLSYPTKRGGLQKKKGGETVKGIHEGVRCSRFGEGEVT